VTSETDAHLGEGTAAGPHGITLVETPGVAVGADDTVYLMTRNAEHP
jgi:hypothetical protein